MPAAVVDRSAEQGTGTWRRWLPIVVVLVWLGGAAVVELQTIWSSYHELGLLDLQVYRMGGRAILDGAPLYEVAYPHDGLLFTYTPFAAIAFVPLALIGWSGGALAISVLTVAAMVRSCVLIERSSRGLDWFTGWASWLRTALLVAVALTIWPTRSTMEYGQINWIVTWLVLEDLLGAGRRARWGGVLTGLAVGIKLTPAFFIVYAAATRQWRRAAVAVAAAAATVALGFVVQRSEAWRYWTHEIYDPTRVGDPGYLGNQSISGALHRLLGSGASSLAWALISAIVAIGAIWLAARCHGAGQELVAIFVTATGALLVSPISWSHHWVWLVLAVPIVLGLVQRLQGGARAVGYVGVALVLWAAFVRPFGLLSNGGSVEYQYSIGQQVVSDLYLWLAAALVLVAWWVGRRSSRRPAAPTRA